MIKRLWTLKDHGSGGGAPASKASKPEENEEEVLQIVDQLTSLHSNKFTVPQYRLWAKFIQSKRHDSYDTPPNIPLITGISDARKHDKKKEGTNFSEAISGAATAFARALSTSPKVMAPIPKHLGQGISPNSHATLRRKHLEDIRMLHSLYEDGILCIDEYREQKENILSTLRELTK